MRRCHEVDRGFDPLEIVLGLVVLDDEGREVREREVPIRVFELAQQQIYGRLVQEVTQSESETSNLVRAF